MKFFKKFFILIILLSFCFIFSFCTHKSGRRDKQNINKNQVIVRTPPDRKIERSLRGKTIVPYEEKNGIKYVWVEINGVRLKFIFDTGASVVSISSAEATVLYKQGVLKKEDIIDMAYFQDATGSISAGTNIILRNIKIGDRVLYDVEAIIVDNSQAPLLLGQSALEKFGKITIDNNKNIIVFE